MILKVAYPCIVCENEKRGWPVPKGEKHRCGKEPCDKCAGTGNMSTEKDTAFIPCDKCISK